MKCPRCGSPDPKKHPAIQFEGEVAICPHSYHSEGIDAEPLGKPLLDYYTGWLAENVRIGLDGLPLTESEYGGDFDPAVIDETARWAEQLVTGQEP